MFALGKQEVADLAVWPDSVPSVPIYKRTLFALLSNPTYQAMRVNIVCNY